MRPPGTPVDTYKPRIRHSLGVEFPRGRTLLPFYAVSAEDPTFTVLLGFWWLHFYQFTTPPKISLRRAGARWSLASTGTAVPTLACLSRIPTARPTPPLHHTRSGLPSDAPVSRRSLAIQGKGAKIHAPAARPLLPSYLHVVSDTLLPFYPNTANYELYRTPRLSYAISAL